MNQRVAGKKFVLALGNFGENAKKVVGAAAKLAGETVVQARDLTEIDTWIGSEDGPPSAVVLDMDATVASVNSLRIRAEHSGLPLPIIGLTNRVRDLTFEEAFSAGIDDVSPVDSQALGRRFRHLAKIQQSTAPALDRGVVIADQDRDTRMLIGRVFRDAGFRVVFASDADVARKYANDSGIAVVVVSHDIDGSAGDSIAQRALQEGNEAAWIINTPPKKIPEMLAQLVTNDSPRITVHDAYAAPASLLFIANDLLNKPATECRASMRLLYGASATFRHAGRDDTEIGYLFNISAEGLYVCTLAPPERNDELWVEFTPPRSDRLVHLEATTVWARRYGAGRTATVPCGFGARLVGGSSANLARYSTSYETFLDERTALRNSTCPAQLFDHQNEQPTVPCGRNYAELIKQAAVSN